MSQCTTSSLLAGPKQASGVNTRSLINSMLRQVGPQPSRPAQIVGYLVNHSNSGITWDNIGYYESCRSPRSSMNFHESLIPGALLSSESIPSELNPRSNGSSKQDRERGSVERIAVMQESSCNVCLLYIKQYHGREKRYPLVNDGSGERRMASKREEAADDIIIRGQGRS
jgi:hypothetical protein